MSKDKAAVRKLLDAVKASGRSSLTAPEGKQVCDAYGIPVPKEGLAKSAADAAKLATGMGFPVVMKIVSPDILHKTEAGGVLVGVKSADEAKSGYETILANAKKYVDGIEAGLAHVNIHTGYKEPSMPFGGVKQSGAGLPENSQTGLEFFVDQKAVYVKG